MGCSRRMSFHLVHCVVLLLVILTWREVSCSSSSSSRRRTSAAAFISLVQEVLRAFKQAITSDPLHSLASWDVSNYSSNPCSWAGLQCDNNNLLTSITLKNKSLQGSISPQLALLPTLSILDLSSNNLSSSLPPSLPRSLSYLDLSYNSLSGTFPLSSISNLSSLQFVSLEYNFLHGPLLLPPSCLPQLQFLSIANNSFSGLLPPCFSLKTLNLSHNLFTGPLFPRGLGNLTTLTQLDVGVNHFHGPIPQGLGNCSMLQFLSLPDNNFSGGIPASLGLGCRSLGFFSLFQNNGSGAIPPEIGLLSKLHYLSLGLNSFTGKILDVLANCSELSTLEMSRNLFTGDLPPDLGSQLPKLSQLNSEFTMFTGSIPASLGNCSGLTFLIMGFNKISELQSVGSIRHRNLIRILGYCSDQQDTNILILEYMPNRSLNDHLHIIPQGGECRLSWEDRHRVATAVAQGLLYLHYDCPAPVIHCDLKPQNILFDADMEVHITDFGLAKVMGDIATSNYTQNMQGTLGYMAPELASYGHISRKCDVYSYGILLMELVSGRKPTDELDGEEGKTLVQWVRSMFEANQAAEIVDQRLHEEYNEHEAKVKLLLSVALQCTQENPRERPTMQQVVQVLLSSSSTSPHAAS